MLFVLCLNLDQDVSKAGQQFVRLFDPRLLWLQSNRTTKLTDFCVHGNVE